MLANSFPLILQATMCQKWTGIELMSIAMVSWEMEHGGCHFLGEKPNRGAKNWAQCLLSDHVITAHWRILWFAWSFFSVIVRGNVSARATAKPSMVQWFHRLPPEYYLTSTEIENLVDLNALCSIFWWLLLYNTHPLRLTLTTVTVHTESLSEAAYYSWGVCLWP